MEAQPPRAVLQLQLTRAGAPIRVIHCATLFQPLVLLQYKLVFLGDQSVGKTSVITRFMYDRWAGSAAWGGRLLQGTCARAVSRKEPGCQRCCTLLKVLKNGVIVPWPPLPAGLTPHIR